MYPRIDSIWDDSLSSLESYYSKSWDESTLTKGISLSIINDVKVYEQIVDKDAGKTIFLTGPSSKSVTH